MTVHPGPTASAAATTSLPQNDELASLITAIAAGDQQALRELYDRTAARVYGLMLRIVHDEAEAADLTRAAYRDIRRRSADFNARTDSALSWIVLAAHSRAVARVRSMPNRPTKPAHAQPATSALDEEQQAIQLAFFDGCTSDEVAAQLQITVSAARRRLSDGMRALRDRHSATA